MGRALAMDGKREKAFLMTKVCARDYAGAMQQLEESLKRLRTSHIDLWQFHECNYFNDAEYLLEKGGLKAALEAKKQGKVRFIGFTGHKAPAIHNKILALNFPWDAVQLPNNVMDARFQSFRAETMPLCLKKGAGIVGMKGCGGDGRMLQAVVDATGLERDRSERALLIATCMLCRRLTPGEAQDLVAQLPSMLQPQLDRCLDGPNRSVSTKAIEDELSRSLAVPAERAREIVRALFKVLSESVSAGQINEVRGQLPEEMKALFPTAT